MFFFVTKQQQEYNFFWELGLGQHFTSILTSIENPFLELIVNVCRSWECVGAFKYFLSATQEVDSTNYFQQKTTRKLCHLWQDLNKNRTELMNVQKRPCQIVKFWQIARAGPFLDFCWIHCYQITVLYLFWFLYLLWFRRGRIKVFKFGAVIEKTVRTYVHFGTFLPNYHPPLL